MRHSGFVILLTAACAWLCLHVSLAREVQLRTGAATLKSTPPSHDAALDPLAYRSSAWGDAPSLRLYLVSYDSEHGELTAGGEAGISRPFLDSALAERGISVLSYIPDSTLLVAAKPHDMADLAKMGVQMAEYGSQHCMAPEWAPIMVPPAATIKIDSAQHRRNLRGQASASDVEDADPRAALLRHMSLFDSRTVPVGAAHDARRRQLVAGEAPPPMFEAKVELVPGIPKAALLAAAEDWPEALAAFVAKNGGVAAGVCEPLVVAPQSAGGSGVCSSDCTLQVFLCASDLAAGVRWLAAQPVVRWVAPEPRMRPHNLASSVLLETGDLTLNQYTNVTVANTSLAYRAAGLDGTGEIVGVGDTGVDLDSCYFADPRINATSYVNLLVGNTSKSYRPADHRKLVQYYMVPGAFFGDDPGVEWGAGHGTHVAGSIGGAILTNLSNPYGGYVTDAATGAAPRSKLSIVDMSVPPSPLTYDNVLYVETFITPPKPLDTAYLPLHTAVNASVISDAWGSQFNVYDANAQAYDRFLWNNPDVVSFVAAGNNGTQSLTPGGTIGTPGTAKNVITVGQSEHVPAAANNTRNVVVVRGYASGATKESWRMSIWPMEAPFQPKLLDVLPTNGTEIPFVWAQPILACTSLTNAAAVKGAVVLVKRGTCLFVTKAQAVAAAGGIAMVIANDVSLMITDPPAAQDSLMMPVSMLTKGVGDLLINNLTAGIRLTASELPVPLSVNTVSVTSSYGPMTDNRIKPDILAPGKDITSAAALGGVQNDTCVPDQRNLTGTSMSTAQAAGHAALIRQYFRTGYYPTGNPANNTSVPFVPSGMLIKAVVIAGAKAMTNDSVLSTGATLGAGPDGFQGFGRMNLAGALPLPTYTNSNFRLQVADRGTVNVTTTNVTMTGLNATGTGPVTIVLTWYDYPADVNAAIQLVNDLDLTVKVGTSTTTLYGNGGTSADRRNTVERVVLAAPAAGAAITITVKAYKLVQVPQRFAVAVVGHFQGTLNTPLNPAVKKP